MQHAFFRAALSGFFLGLCLMITLLASLPQAALAVSRQDILEPYEDQLAQSKAALAELERQAGLHLQELQERKEYLEARREDVETAASRIRQEFKARSKALDRAVLAAWQLVSDLDETVHVPLHGFVTIKELRDRREAQTLDMEERLVVLENGEYELEVPGLGLITRNELENRISDVQASIEALQNSVEAGEYEMHYPGLGRVDRKTLTAHKELVQERMKTVADQIKAGDYVLVLPHLGPTSKNQLDARIAALKEEMETLKQNFKEGRERILRANIEWSDETTVAAQLEALQNETKELRQALKDKSAQFLLPTGWTTAKDLQERIKTLEQAAAEVEKQRNAKTYEVALPDGTWANEKELDKALVNAVIAPEIRKGLEKGRKNIAVSSRVDQEQRRIEQAKLENWLQGFESLADPKLALLQFESEWKKTMLREFKREEKQALRWMTERLRWLERYKRYLP